MPPPLRKFPSTQLAPGEAQKSYLSVRGKWGEGQARGYVYFGGQRIAEYGNSTTYFAHNDHLGSPRLLTDVTAFYATDCYDFFPFGERNITTNPCSSGAGPSPANTTHLFTEQQRDTESNLDNFAARYFSSNQGRFMSPDPAGILAADPSAPQSWNGYAYVQNNPINLIDPSGLDGCSPLVDDTASCVLSTFGGLGGGDGGSVGFGSFGGGIGNFSGSIGVNPFLTGAWLWTPNGYNPCPYGCGPPRQPSAFSAPSGPIGPPSFGGSLIPIYGSLRSSINDYQTGHYIWGTVQAGLAVSDVFLVKAIATSVAKGGIKLGTVGLSKLATKAGSGSMEGLFTAVKAHGRTIVIAEEGSEELRYLNKMRAEGNCGGPGCLHILLRPNASKAAILEEFLHGTQARLGLLDQLGIEGAEEHIKAFMLRHRRMLGLP